MDGFDLGIGILFPFLPAKEDRHVMMNTVAPVWDGNETWLVLGGAGLLAAFPLAYSVILTAFYLPLILMLQQRMRELARYLMWALLAVIAAISIWTPLAEPAIAERWFTFPNIVWFSPRSRSRSGRPTVCRSCAHANRAHVRRRGCARSAARARPVADPTEGVLRTLGIRARSSAAIRAWKNSLPLPLRLRLLKQMFLVRHVSPQLRAGQGRLGHDDGFPMPR